MQDANAVKAEAKRTFEILKLRRAVWYHEARLLALRADRLEDLNSVVGELARRVREAAKAGGDVESILARAEFDHCNKGNDYGLQSRHRALLRKALARFNEAEAEIADVGGMNIHDVRERRCDPLIGMPERDSYEDDIWHLQAESGREVQADDERFAGADDRLRRLGRLYDEDEVREAAFGPTIEDYAASPQ